MRRKRVYWLSLAAVLASALVVILLLSSGKPAPSYRFVAPITCRPAAVGCKSEALTITVPQGFYASGGADVLVHPEGPCQTTVSVKYAYIWNEAELFATTA